MITQVLGASGLPSPFQRLFWVWLSTCRRGYSHGANSSGESLALGLLKNLSLRPSATQHLVGIIPPCVSRLSP